MTTYCFVCTSLLLQPTWVALDWNGILHAVNDGVAIYHAASETDPEHYPAGWYVDNKEDIVSAIATDPEAISEIKPHLVKAGYPFEEREAFWKNTYQNIFSDKN